MELEVVLEDFNRAVRAVRPALKDAPDGGEVVHLLASDDTITLVATGRTMTFRQRLSARVLEHGEVVVPARFLADVCTRGTDKELELRATDVGDLGVKCGGLEATIRRRPGDPPVHVIVDSPNTIGELSPSELERMAAVASAASAKLDRPILTGIHLASGVAEATDSYHVVRTTLATWSEDVVIPALLLQPVASGDTAVSATFDGRKIAFGTGLASWTGPVLAYSYPRLDQFFAQAVVDTFVCNREQLTDAVGAASVVHGAPVHLVGEGARLRVWSESAQMGLVQTSLPAEARSGCQASFSAAYLQEALRVATADEVHLELTEKSVLIRCGSFEQLVMKQLAATEAQDG